MKFSTPIGEWKPGWAEDQSSRELLAKKLKAEASKLPLQFRTVGDRICYRKRFLVHGDIGPLLQGDLHDGITSWTLDKDFADIFKGYERQGAITATIFEHRPSPSEVILNIAALWDSDEFKAAVASCQTGNGAQAKSYEIIGARQSEVVLEALLRYDEITVFTGRSSPFDELCAAAGIQPEDEDAAWRLLINLNKQPDTPRYVQPDKVKDILERVKAKAIALKLM